MILVVQKKKPKKKKKKTSGVDLKRIKIYQKNIFHKFSFNCAIAI